MLFRICLVAALLFPTGAATALEPNSSESAQWNQWRGPNRDGHVTGPAWPDRISGASLKKVWTRPLGPSYSGPIVADDKVFVTETVDRKYEVTTAFNRLDGKKLWTTRWEGAMTVPFFANANGSWIRATPAYDGERLYVAGIRDVLVCLNANDGKEVWKVNFVERFKSSLPSFGMVSSPLIIGEHVYIQGGGGFVKMKKATGEVVWRTLSDGGGMFGSAFSSPFLAKLNDSEQLLVQTRAALTGVDPESGRVLWSQKIPAFRGMNILTPTVVDGGIFTSAYGGRSFLFTPQKSGDQWTVEQEWENKVQGYMSSPVVIDDHVYIHLRNQRFACINLKTGKEAWITKPFGKYWSLVANGDKILALDESGELLLIRANPKEFELFDRQKVGDDSWAHLAVTGKHVMVRELNALTVYEWE